MNRDPEKMAWEDFTHVAGLFPTLPTQGRPLLAFYTTSVECLEWDKIN